MMSTGLKIGKGLVCVFLLMLAGSAFAAGADDGFKTFWEQFTTAVVKGDATTVSRMVKYPIYFSDGQRQIADFPMIWKSSFKASQRSCLAKQKPVSAPDGEGHATYSAFCGPLIYVFGKDSGGWRLTDFSAND